MLKKIEDMILICRIVKTLGIATIAISLLISILCILVAGEHGNVTAAMFVFAAMISCGFLLLSEYVENLLLKRKRRIIRRNKKQQVPLKVIFM